MPLRLFLPEMCHPEVFTVASRTRIGREGAVGMDKGCDLQDLEGLGGESMNTIAHREFITDPLLLQVLKRQWDRTLSTATGPGRAGRLIKRWHRPSSISPRATASPLLSNLVLDELDGELERRGHRFVRYADACNIYVRSERAGQRVMRASRDSSRVRLF